MGGSPAGAPALAIFCPTGLFSVHCAVTTRPGLGLERFREKEDARIWADPVEKGQADGEGQMIAFLRMVLYRCGMTIALICGIAALTILAALVINKLSDSEAWIAVVFFAMAGGFSWMVGRAARAPDDVLSD